MLANIVTKTTRDRWKGMTIGAVSLALMLLFGMSVYREFDLSVYTDLPEALRAVMNIPEGTDVAGLAYGAIYSAYGALTVAALALAMGAASVAGEERDGTIGLLLANPRSRTRILASKTASMVLLTALGSVVLWAAGRIAPEMLDVAVGGTHVGALVFHMFVNALFYGFLAMAIGAWTGSTGLAAGATTGVMIVSLFAAGMLPLVEGWENVAKAFPWYYFDGSSPITNGVDWGHVGVLAAGCAVFAGIAVLGVNRRDLKGQTVGVTLLDRLRANPMTRTLADRLAGSARVSRIWIKTASEHQGVLVVTAGLMFLMGLMIGPMYNLINADLLKLTDQMPEAVMALFGADEMSTPNGWYQGEIFGLMAPIAVMVVGIAVGSRALAGEEARRTMGLLLANPVRRSRIVLEKAGAMALLVIAVGFSIFAGVAAGSIVGTLGMSMANIAATSILATLIGLVFGGLALALSAATGRTRIASFGTVGIGLALYVANAFLPLNDSSAGLANWTPFHYYLSSDPLANGMNWAHGGLLAGLGVGLVAGSVWAFQRRDLRQTG